ncbi:MAG: hypothetical protein J0L92_13660, partial [Deltaproteobacteria bacterium]|nr:hypothetical protein [Deltaproteobacteria bacterium]
MVARAKPHPRCRSWVGAVLACGIAACDAPAVVATDANDVFDVSRGADTGALEADATAAPDAR